MDETGSPETVEVVPGGGTGPRSTPSERETMLLKKDIDAILR